MTPANLRVDGARLWSSLMEMARIGATARGGCNRQALTDMDRQARDVFVRWARALNCTIEVDEVGNIFARRAGAQESAAPVLTGSHLDTQETGGRFDGVYGVLAGLEVLRTLEQHEIRTRRPLEVAVWTNEEGCRFAPAMLGSGVVAGTYDLTFAYSRTDKSGLRLGDELRRIGYLGSRPAQPRNYQAVFEAHIEQGPILERTGDTIGVVMGIQGAYSFDVTLTGVAAHAGPTPMEMRRDPWPAATRIIDGALALAHEHTPWGRATIGNVSASPGARNTVPETLTFSVDLRHPDPDVLDAMVARLSRLVEASGRAANVDAQISTVWRMAPTAFDCGLTDTIENCARALGYRVRRIISGAGHDSLHTAQYAPTAMIFVPCAGGVSHNEAESATAADLEAGANVLLHSMLASAT